MAAERLLLQFSREPVSGQVKTRMIPALGEEGACRLHGELTAFACNMLLDSQLAPVELAVGGDCDHALFRQLQASGVSAVWPQQGADLGQRMHHALVTSLERYTAVVLVGSDCPQLDVDYLAAAFAALERVPVVLGPAGDGGYVLLGVTQVRAQWFEGVTWGSEQVLEQTEVRLCESDTAWERLPVRADIDRPEDLALWQAIKGAG
jgi:rSAM/selenodomain-associated transferase 1